MLKEMILNISPMSCVKNSDSEGVARILLASNVPYFSLIVNDTVGTILIPIDISVPFRSNDINRGIAIKSYEILYGLATMALDAAPTAIVYAVNTNSTTIVATAKAIETNALTYTPAGANYKEKINLSVVSGHVYNEDTKFYIQIAYNGGVGSEIKIFNTKVKYDLLED
jgi:hypothetical protein